MPSRASNQLTHLSRLEATRELQRLSALGYKAARDLLSIIDEDNFDRWWPYIAPLLDQLMYVEQRAGREVLGTYLLATGLAAGMLMTTSARPDLSFMSYRNGRLPSGMPWARLIYAAPLTVQRRVEAGMPMSVALSQTKHTILGAINSQAHAEMRMGTKDVLDVATRRPTVSVGTEQRVSPPVTFTPTVSAEPEGEPDFFPAEHDYRRWIRQPSPGACSWCLMQATRGAVFYSKQTAVSAGHAHCKCVVFPEPSPGAYRNVSLIDPSEIKNAVWRDPKSKREYDIRAMLARTESARTDLILRRDGLVLAA